MAAAKDLKDGAKAAEADWMHTLGRVMVSLGVLIGTAVIGWIIARGDGAPIIYGILVAAVTTLVGGLAVLMRAGALDHFLEKEARGLVVIVAVSMMLAVGVRADPDTPRLADRILVWAYVAFVVGLAELFVLFVVSAISGRIDLSRAFLDKPPGEAPVKGAKPAVSLSRLQAFIWTLVVMIVYFHRVVQNVANHVTELPTIPPELLMVMGISGAVYLTSKGIEQSATATTTAPAAPGAPAAPAAPAAPTPAPAPAPPGPQPGGEEI